MRYFSLCAWIISFNIMNLKKSIVMNIVSKIFNQSLTNRGYTIDTKIHFIKESVYTGRIPLSSIH